MMSYWKMLVNDIPHELYFLALIILFASLLLFVGWKGLRKGFRYSLGVLLVEYVVLIYCSTVLLRPTNKIATYDFKPFWSYQAFWDGREPNALIENFSNVLAFVPVGVILGCMIKTSWLKNSKGWLIALFVGLGLSIGIEGLQLVFKKGFSETDDVMHNTIGCLIGYVIWLIVLETWVSSDLKH